MKGKMKTAPETVTESASLDMMGVLAEVQIWV